MNPQVICSDQQLISEYLETGDNDFLAQLIVQHKQRIFTVLHALLKDHHLAEDFFQDVCIKIIQTIRAGKYNEQGKFLPWALRIAHNYCMDHFRKVKKPVNIVTSEGYEMWEVFGLTTDSPEQDLVKEEEATEIRSLIDQLPQEQKSIVILRMYGDLSFKEIANLQKISINTALGRMRYALINLRKLLNQNTEQSIQVNR